MTNKATEQFFKEQQQLAGNNVCADCGQRHPTWSSTTFGTYICYPCSGEHRALGPQVSFVKSVKMDVWSSEQLKVMQELGNVRANAILEARLPADYPRPTSVEERRNFIRNKYLKKIWVDPNAPVPPSYAQIFPGHPVVAANTIKAATAAPRQPSASPSPPTASPAHSRAPSVGTPFNTAGSQRPSQSPPAQSAPSFFATSSPSASPSSSPSPATPSGFTLTSHPKAGTPFGASAQAARPVSLPTASQTADEPLLLETPSSSAGGKFDINEEIRRRLGGQSASSPAPAPAAQPQYYGRGMPTQGYPQQTPFAFQQPAGAAPAAPAAQEEDLLLVDPGHGRSMSGYSDPHKQQIMSMFSPSPSPSPSSSPPYFGGMSSSPYPGQPAAMGGYPQPYPSQSPPSGSVWH